MVRGWTLLILEVKGPSQWTRREISCEVKVTMDIYGDMLLNTIPHGKPY